MVAAPAGPPPSACAGFVADALILPTRNVRLFSPTPSPPSPSPSSSPTLSPPSSERTTSTRCRPRRSGSTPRRCRPSTSRTSPASSRRRQPSRSPPAARSAATVPRPRALFAGAALVAAAELACTAVPAYYLDSWYRYSWNHPDTGGVESFVQGVLLFVFLATLLFRLCLPAVFPVAIAASATAAAEEGGGGGGGAAAHLHRAWRLMTAAASWKEAALQVIVVSVVLPLATYPVYAFALDCGQAQGGCLLLLGSMYGFLLPSAGVQLYSAVAATVFYHRCMEQQRHDLAIPLTMKVMKLGNTPLNSLKLIKGAIA